MLFNLVTIGEAVKNAPEEIRSRHPQVTWREVGRFGDLSCARVDWQNSGIGKAYLTQFSTDLWGSDLAFQLWKHLVAHHYFRLDSGIVWGIVQTDLPELAAQVASIITLEDKESE